MNKPSSTITAAAAAGMITGLLLIALAAIFPEIYSRIQLYAGAEAHLTGAIMVIIGYLKKENVLPLK